MELIVNIAELIFPFILFIFKSYIPYRIKIYSAKRNPQIIADVKKEMGIEIIRFPSDLLMIAAAYDLAKLLPYINILIDETGNMARDAFNNIMIYLGLLIGIIFILLPLCVIATRKCESLYFPDSGTQPKKRKSVIFEVLIYLGALTLVFWLLV